MSDLIYREDALESIAIVFDRYLTEPQLEGSNGALIARMARMAGMLISRRAPVDAEPVSRGSWKLGREAFDGVAEFEEDTEWYLECPVCGRRVWDVPRGWAEAGDLAALTKEYPYCHCGVKMGADISVLELARGH